MSNQIQIRCQGAVNLSYALLEPFQGELKSLSQENYERLKKEILKDGFSFAPHVWNYEGHWFLIDGHQRIRVVTQMVKEGYQIADIPCAIVEAKTYKEAKRKVLAAASQYGTLESQGLYELMNEADLVLEEMEDFHFPEIDLEKFEAEYGQKDLAGEDEEDDVPVLDQVEPRTKRGDIYVLGDHRLLCGDSTLIEDVERLMAGEKADMVFTDPPWNVNYGALESGHGQGRQIMNDHMDALEWTAFCGAFTATLFAVTRPGSPIYLVMSAQEWPVIDPALREAGFHWSSTIVWAKDRFVLSRKDYHTQYEPIWYGWNEEGPRLVTVDDRTQSDLWHCTRPSKSELHPTTKPVELVERAIRNSSKRGARVLDLFGGSGSTLIAGEKTGRRVSLCELDPHYCDVIVARWEQYTGRKTELAASQSSLNPEVLALSDAVV